MHSKKSIFSLLPSWLVRFDFMGVFEQDPFGNYLIIKRIIIFIIGWFTYYRYTAVNKIEIIGSDQLIELPDNGVLFLSNHQTYFADVIAFYHIFCATKWGYKDTISPPFYLFSPRARCYYVAASETMKEGILPKLFSIGGAITIERSWRANGENVKRQLDNAAQDKIGMGLKHGWVVSFPQGTTKPYAPVRKGTAHLIKDHQPIVIPVVINGFRRAFDKKGLRFKKRNTKLTVHFKPPMHFLPDESLESMIDRVTKAIEQEAPKDGAAAIPVA
ncbi:lysophospholipid acyltransferase family protein [Dyadobacter psychrophilus]|uniref:1-acyl-sn-glycerol-3-phosphate acyltransferase n=1 Tax=Dyadobacter psychrophilus TaxID=651661 RepID=A0A1T5H3C6_9BACT|nr:lysophospholipid acyltransferase family protein [Dyadobacter psychrophilus]SKC15099.1 1-acyl-sn-glycerol-3-phosphate acyltransferase [Dyadobacter psychrophilus]